MGIGFYNVKCYRLTKETIKNLEKISQREGLTYNLLFRKLIDAYNSNKGKSL